VQVFRSLLECTPLHRQVAAASWMADFEAALWIALTDAFPDTVINGCACHLTQTIWRQARGLQSAYNSKRRPHTLIR